MNRSSRRRNACHDGADPRILHRQRLETIHGKRRGGLFDPVRQVAFSDTHRGNLILMADALLAPIDLRVQALSGARLDCVVRACRE